MYICMCFLGFYSKTGFWPSYYCQISTDLDKILHTPFVWITEYTYLDRDRRVGGSTPNQNDYVFL